MELKVGVKLSKQEVFDILTYFDDSSDTPLHEGLDFVSYSEKLSKFAYFVLAMENDQMYGFIAYYLNEEGKFIYVPQVVVHRDGRHRGVGHRMFEALESCYNNSFESIRLEVLKENLNARNFYVREGFGEFVDHKERILLTKNIEL